MAAVRWPIVAGGVAALAGALGWVVTRPAAPGSHPHDLAAPGPFAGPVAGSAPAGPALAGPAARSPAANVVPGSPGSAADPGPATGSPAAAGRTTDARPPASAVTVSAQVRDPAWAGPTEQTIQRRLAAVAPLRKTECRQDTCELTLGGSAEEVGAALAALEGRAGLRDLAAHVLLTAPETLDGVMTLRAYVQFDR